MNIVNLVDNLHPTDTDMPTVLNSCWTDDKSLCSPSMLASGEQMLNDMIEAQDLVAALYYADKIGVDYPKLSARIWKSDEIWRQSVSVTILSPVSEEFFNLYTSIQDGHDAFGLKTRTKDRHIVSIRQTDRMKQFIFNPTDTVTIINETQKQR
tara:strand:- start:609 stop:1067 length:459 start_codon:yes stop_codon:yes gene_type:complete